MSPVDIVILLVVVAAVALIVRGMLRGSVRTCNCGDCASCPGTCDCCHQSAKRR